MGKRSTVVSAVLAAAFAAAASAQTRPQAVPPGSEEGFFRPSRDPALTSIRPPPAPAESRPDAPVPAEAVTTVVVDMAEEVREAEEERMDRVEAAAAQARANAPVITSPLDGTAPIMSPLDGSAPIVSPVGR